MPTRTCNASDAGEPPQNKANFPKRGTEAVSLLRTADWGWSRIGSPACALLPLACVGWLHTTKPITDPPPAKVSVDPSAPSMHGPACGV